MARTAGRNDTAEPGSTAGEVPWVTLIGFFVPVTTPGALTQPYDFSFTIMSYADGTPVYQSSVSIHCDGGVATLVSLTDAATTGGGSVAGPATPTTPVPGPDMVAIPDTAVVGRLPPPPRCISNRSKFCQHVQHEGWTIAVGFRVGRKREFYQVLLSGQTYWVPVDHIGPTSTPCGRAISATNVVE